MKPAPLYGPFAWYGDQIHDASVWQFRLNEGDLVELDKALHVAGSKDCTISTVDARDFPFDALQLKLQAIAAELESGCGFVRIKGFPLDRWSARQRDLLWMGICHHLGRPVFQNPHGQLLRSITSEGDDVGRRYGQLATAEGQFLSSRARTASNAELRFHTDRCDIVGLLCIGQAANGGDSRIASSVTVHNEMLKHAPELCAVLYEDLPRSRIGEEEGGESAWYRLPVWAVEKGKFTSHYSRTYVEALEHVPGAPEISPRQRRAMDMLAQLAAKNAFAMRLEPGDIQLLNNHVIYHARDSYQDSPSEGRVRNLLRIWLSAPHRSLPASHKVLWGEVESGKMRGGIGQANSAASV